MNPLSVILLTALLVGGAMYVLGAKYGYDESGASNEQQSTENTFQLSDAVLPREGIVLRVRWGNLGSQMVKEGVIDAEKMDSLYAQRGGMTDEMQKLLYGENNGNLVMTQENAGMMLNLFWALGLSTQSDILENGPMTDSRYGTPAGFASTGGWTLSTGNVMQHYSRHPFVTLTAEQNARVARVAQNIYRPCCNNSTHFPDCNHGMAMLGLLELMAANDRTEEEMYRVALQANAYWFPENYLTIAQYLRAQGVEWEDADPKEILGAEYSSASGYARIRSLATQPVERSESSCGV